MNFPKKNEVFNQNLQKKKYIKAKRSLTLSETADISIPNIESFIERNPKTKNNQKIKIF